MAALYQDDSPLVSALLISTNLSSPGQGNPFCSWIYTYTYKIQDIFGNFVTCEVKRSGSDPTAPTYTVPPDITLYENDLCDLNEFNPDPSVSGNITDATDNCEVNLITYQDCEGRRGTSANSEGCSFPCIGTRIIERTWRVSDACGNATEKVQVITIMDNTPPVFTTCPQNFSNFVCDNVTYNVEATDNCIDPVNFTYEFTGATTGSGSGTGSGSQFLSGGYSCHSHSDRRLW